MADPCKQEKEIERLDTRLKVVETDVSALKEGHAETKVYMKIVIESIADLKQQIKDLATSISTKDDTTAVAVDKTNKAWAPIVLELIKALGMIAGIIAAIKIAG